MGVLVHMPNQFDPLQRSVHRLERPITVRRLVQRHRALRSHTRVYRPGGIYGRRKVREFSRPTVCLFNGAALTRKDWQRTTVGPRDVVAFYTPPTGGRGTLMTIIMVVAMVAIAVAAPYLAGPAMLGFAAGTTAFTIATAVIGVALNAAVMGVMSMFAEPAPQAAAGGFAGGTPASSPVYNFNAQGNYARLGNAIPEAFGRNRMFPDFVTTPYQTFVNEDETPGPARNDQYIHSIVGLGIGEFAIDADTMQLGDTPFSSYEDIEWAVIPPGALPNLAIADERWITATDLATVELLDATEGSPWAGPYRVNPSQTTINRIGIDTAAPRGLWAFNPISDDHTDAQEVTFEIEAQLIDDLGLPIGDPAAWEALGEITYNRRSPDPQRFTAEFALPSAGRWQARLRRTDTKNTSMQAGHQLDWIGLRGRVIGRRTFPNMTCIQLKMKASAALSAAQSRSFNVVAVRKLETWDEGAGAMGAVKAPTRNPCDAFAYIARTLNGGKLRDEQIDLAGLYAHYDDFNAKAWHFNFVFDSTITVSEALARVARAVIAERVTQGPKLYLIRDEPVAAPVAMFSPRNITAGSLSIVYTMPDATTPDAIIGEYIEPKVWKPVEVTAAFPDSAQLRPIRTTLHGVGNREQARAVLWNIARGNRYRRRALGWTTPLEGMAVTFGDGVSLSHDVPRYGQTLEVIDFDGTDPLAPVFTFVDRPVITPPTDHYAALRDSLGRKAGPFRAHRVAGEPYKLWLQLSEAGDLPEILVGGDRERTWLQLGPGEEYGRPLKVKQVTPRDATSFEIVAFDDDPRMYAPLPIEPEVPIGADTAPITIAITNADGPVVNLRALADEHDYTGLAAQLVTFTAAAGVAVAIVRGSWPPLAQPVLQLAGILSGVAGAPGAPGIGGAGAGGGGGVIEAGAGNPGGAGGIGGTALDASTGALKLTGAGTIRGGKGGGGGGGGGGGAVGLVGEGFFLQVLGGAGGAGNGAPGQPGSTVGAEPYVGTSGAGGTGGVLAGSWAGAGSPGGAGLPGSSTQPEGGPLVTLGGAGGLGGPGGKAIAGNANVNRSGFTGTIIGATS